jgi:alkyldihydroxyacetonephosphate synthase
VNDELASLLGERLLVGESRGGAWWPGARAGALELERAAAVAEPETVAEVRAILAVCGREGIPVTPLAGDSSVCGQTAPVAGGLVLDLTRLNAILELDEESLAVTVQPGVFGHTLEAWLRGRGYTHGHFPQSVELSTVGGWLACRSAGQYSTRYGKIEEIVLAFDVALANGGDLSFPALPADAHGPDLRRLFLGSEGKLGVITQATLRVHPAPRAEARSAHGFATFAAGLDAVRRVLRRASPAVLRLYDAAEAGRGFGEERALLIALAEGEPDEVAWQSAVVREEAGDELDPALVGHWLEHRNDVSALDHALAAGLVVDTIETVALWRDVPKRYDDVVAAIAAVPGTLGITAHCSHPSSSGACLYFTFAGQPPADPRAYHAAVWKAALAAGAQISHHHGVGVMRAAALGDTLGPAGTSLLRAVKHELDPAGILQPDPMVDMSETEG